MSLQLCVQAGNFKMSPLFETYFLLLRKIRFMLQVLLLDNHDSFTYNLVQLLRECGVEQQLVIRTCDDEPALINWHFDRIVLSPGPGLPSESGFLAEYIRLYAGKVPMLGVCLGHQAIAEYFGARLAQLSHSVHGERSPVDVDTESLLFRGLEPRIHCGRYHSWVVEPASLPPALKITATDLQGNIMAFEHRQLPVYGVQFHPESYMTEGGGLMMRNFLSSSFGK